MILNREQALRVSKRVYENIKVPELDGELRMASISAGTSLLMRGLQARKAKGEDVEREMMLAFRHGSASDLEDSHGAWRHGATGKLRGQPERRLAFRLCLAFGWPSPDDVLNFLSPAEFNEWGEFFALEPWGFGVEDLRLGKLSSVIAGAAGAKTEPKDFMMRPPPEPTPEQEEELEHDDLVDKLQRAFVPRPPASTSSEKL